MNNYQISFPRKHKSAAATKVLGAPALSSHSNKWQRFSQVNGPTCDHGQGGGHFKSIDEIDLLSAGGGGGGDDHCSAIKFSATFECQRPV